MIIKQMYNTYPHKSDMVNPIYNGVLKRVPREHKWKQIDRVEKKDGVILEVFSEVEEDGVILEVFSEVEEDEE